MIKTFKHKGLKLFWESGNAKQLPQDLIANKNWGIHKLKGNYNDYWSLIVKENWRIIFRFDEESVYDVNLVDYH